MHPEAFDGLDRMLTSLDIDRTSPLRVLDLGGQDINGSVRPLLPNANWTGLDLYPGAGIDLVCDATLMLFAKQIYDLVVCTEVLEHVEDWPNILRFAATAAPLLALTCASLNRPAHGAWGDPLPGPDEYYGNVSPPDLREVAQIHYSRSEVFYHYPPGDAYLWARND